MVNVQLDRDILDRLKREKNGDRDSYNDVLRKLFLELDNYRETE